LERLDEGIDHRLTLISAPAGYGKTTLLASWLDRRKRAGAPVAWLSLEDEDSDPIRFFAYFIAAWQRVDPAIGQTAQAYLESPRVPNCNHLMTLIVNDVARRSSEIFLVLDDYHVIHDSAVQEAVRFFIEHMPGHCHLIMATREELSLPLHRLRAREEVTEIRLQDIRFTTDETALFLSHTMGLKIAPEVALAIETHIEGWIAGLQLVALSLRAQANESAMVPAIEGLSGGNRDIMNYLAAEVLRQQPEEIQAFLQHTSILDRFNRELCDAVTGHRDSGRILAALERANLFLIPLDERREWFRYHHLFAELLRQQLSPPQQEQLHALASRWYANNGYTAEAIKHALAARSYGDAVALIRRGSEETRRAGGFHTLLGWINALPEWIVREHSDLLVHKGWIAHMRGELLTGEAYAALAVERESPNDPPIRRGMLLAFRAYLAINSGRAELALRLAQDALSLLGESYYGVAALCYVGQSQRLLGEREAAIETLRRAAALGDVAGNPASGLEAVCYLAILLYQQGRLREAILLCQDAADRYLDSQGHSLPVAATVHATLGALCYEANDLTGAYHHASRGITLGQQLWGNHEVILGQLTLARIHQVEDEIEALWETLASARQLAAKSPSRRYSRLVVATTAELQLRRGLVRKAAATFAELPASVADRSSHENVLFARLQLAQGHVTEAYALLATLENLAREQQRLGALIPIQLVKALCEHALGRTGAAQTSLAASIEMAAAEGYRRVFLDEKTLLAPLLPQVESVAPLFVGSLLQDFRNGDRRAQAGSSGDRLVERLTGNQLTILRLVADGLSNREIADKLAITEGTTKWHLNQIFGKLNVGSRTQAIARARHMRVI
jgi:LuxR family maltose regulon positive regulatory protein